MLRTCRARFVYVFLRHQQRRCGYESELDSRAEPGIHGAELDTCCWNGLVSKTLWNRALSFAFQPTMMNVKGRVCEYRFSCAAERVVDLDWFDPLSRPAAGCTLSPPLPDYSVDCVMLWFDLAFPLSMPTNEDDAVIMVAWVQVLHVG